MLSLSLIRVSINATISVRCKAIFGAALALNKSPTVYRQFRSRYQKPKDDHRKYEQVGLRHLKEDLQSCAETIDLELSPQSAFLARHAIQNLGYISESQLELFLE
jgi:hypothetical protein